MKQRPRLKSFARQLRKDQTQCEQKLWYELRALKQYGYRFCRQVIFQDYIVDFACHKAKLIIEVDGDSHVLGDGVNRDKVRDKYLAGRGYTVFRVSNPDIYENLGGVMGGIMERLAPARLMPSLLTEEHNV